MVDRRTEEFLPLDIIVVTTDRDLPALEAALQQRGVEADPITGVLLAGTKLHGGAVYRLGGVLQPNGFLQPMPPDNIANAQADTFGTWGISRDGLDDPLVLRAYWHLVNGVYSVAPQLDKLARKDGPAGEQAALLKERFVGWAQQRINACGDGAIADLETYLAAELVRDMLEASGMREFRDDAKSLNERMKDAAGSEALKDEIIAMQAYRTLMGMAVSRKSSDLKKADEGLAQVAERYPRTVFGQRAQAYLRAH